VELIGEEMMAATVLGRDMKRSASQL